VLAATVAACGGGSGSGAAQAPRETTAQPAGAVDLDPGEQPRARSRPRPHRRKHHAPAPTAPTAAVPPTVSRPIPYGPQRRAEMAAYSQRHYGQASWRLTDPQVIVEHYTASNSFDSAYNTFAQDTPDVELHELPGVCAHFIVDRDGTIYQLVKTSIRCRHTVGLNYTAIGIEHVGTSDAAVMGNSAQLGASIALTNWLRCTQGIDLANVIGHNESLSSPFHHEAVPALRTQTHGDMRHATMKRYRALLARTGC
jgi:hypothetical protein